ncbi:MAG TPA: GerMN domain-containing protein [Mobilitalea sp.]|nr:GerMN domain-containing protein [Mobilitalea sp.]
MKKILIGISIIFAMFLMIGCGKDKGNKLKDTEEKVPPTPTVVATLPVEEEEVEATPIVDDITESELTIQDYYPLLSDIEYIYEGMGNEYASFTKYIDYLDSDRGRIQTRSNNGGTETVRVIEVNDKAVTVIYIISESYYRDNLLNYEGTEDQEEILLQEPLTIGTTWEIPDGRKRSITATNVNIQTPSGNYKALEVTTEGIENKIMDYYAKEVGLVKSIFQGGNMEISSTLSEINQTTPLIQSLTVFYPDQDEKLHAEQLNVSFHTGDITRLILKEALVNALPKESYLPLFSPATTIKSLYLGTDGIVYVDFSRELVTDMNVGAGYEMLILQGIANTLGNYYGAKEIILTVDSKPYESGHISALEGETIKVNLENVEY